MERKTKFRIALAIRSEQARDRYTARDFASEHDCSITMLYGVLRGTHTSARLDEAIDHFIEEQLGYLRDQRESELAAA